MSQMFYPTLTTIQQDGTQRARIAIESLHALKIGQQAEYQVMLPVKPVVRDSTA